MWIKKRFRKEIGEWMRCSIGVSTNRFLAKLAASLHKPDGLDVIDHTNVLDVYKRVSLLDLNGINTRFQARLNAYGIFTPMEFYHASLEVLKKQVFQSILGYYWYLRLRGHEIDAIDFKRKSFCALSQLSAGFAIIPCQPASGILANFLMVLKGLVLLFATIYGRKCRLLLTACQKISRVFL